MSPLMSSLPRRQVGLSSRVKNSAFLLVGTFAVFLVAGLVSSVRSQAFLPANMADAMDASLFLNKFKSAVDQVGYADAIVDPNFAGTIFAPVDLGFDALLLKSNATWDQLIASNATLARLVNLHIVPDQKLFPLTTLKAGMRLKTHLEGYDLFVNRDTPGIVHIYAVEKPEVDPLNFATVLQYQEIKGGKAILYVVDKVMVPPTKPTAIAAADPAAAAAAKKQLKL